MKLLLFYLIGKESTKWSLHSLFSLNNIKLSLRFLLCVPLSVVYFCMRRFFSLTENHMKVETFLVLEANCQIQRRSNRSTLFWGFTLTMDQVHHQYVYLSRGKKKTTTHSIIMVNGPYMKTSKQKGPGLLCLFPPAVSWTTGHLTKCITRVYLIH